jgi:hypothetical protein
VIVESKLAQKQKHTAANGRAIEECPDQQSCDGCTMKPSDASAFWGIVKAPKSSWNETEVRNGLTKHPSKLRGVWRTNCQDPDMEELNATHFDWSDFKLTHEI